MLHFLMLELVKESGLFYLILFRDDLIYQKFLESLRKLNKEINGKEGS